MDVCGVVLSDADEGAVRLGWTLRWRMRFIDSCGASQQRATPKLAHAGYTVGDGGEGDDVSLGVGG